MTPRELESLNSDFMVQHLNRSRIASVRTRKNQRRFIYLVKSSMPYSSSKGHVASLLFSDLPPLAKIPVNAGSPMNQTIKAGCTCPAWRYWGPSYNSSNEKYRLPSVKKQTIVPQIRDPDLKNKACKHVIKVIKHIKRKSFTKLLGEFNITRNASLIRPAVYDYLFATSNSHLFDELAFTPDEELEDFCESVGIFPS